MGLNDNHMVTMETRLNKERQDILEQKRYLLHQFREYALNKFQEINETINISYSTVNGSETLKFVDLNMGDNIEIEIVTFNYNNKTQTIDGHLKKIFRGVKQTNDFLDNVKLKGNKYSIKKSSSHSIEEASKFDSEKIKEAITKGQEEVLRKIFASELVFDDDEYKKLVSKNIAINKEQKRLDNRIKILRTINSEPQTESPKKR